MPLIQDLKENILGGYKITCEDAIQLLSEDLQELRDVAASILRYSIMTSGRTLSNRDLNSFAQ